MSGSLILPKSPKELPLPYLIICEGYGDAVFLDKLLRHHAINNCNIGCPNRDTCEGLPGANLLQQYVGAMEFLYRSQRPRTLKGVLLVVDEDGKPASQFALAKGALEYAGFAPLPDEAFTIYEDNEMRVGVFIMPGEGRSGTLEHVLLDAALDGKPELLECLTKFGECTEIVPTGTANQQAKMKMSILVGAHCKENPWASPSMVWNDKGNPIPIASAAFNHIVEFVHGFAQP